MNDKVAFDLQDDRDLSAWNGTVLDTGDGGNVFVCAVLDRNGKRSLAMFAGHGPGQITMLDSADVLKLMDAIAYASAAHGAPAGRVIW